VQVITRGYAAPGHEPGGGGGAAANTVQSRRNSGSGVIVDPAGYVITNAHVIGAARRVEVVVPQTQAPPRAGGGGSLRPPGRTMPAEIVGMDREADLAVLKIALDNAPHLEFADSDVLRQGQVVLAFGSPFGLTNSVSMGVVSSVAREVRSDDPMVYIQTDASINPGNSGGPLVNAAGRIVGINTFVLSGGTSTDGIGFAIPSNTVRNVYDQIRKQGFVRRGQIGVLPQNITPELAEALALAQDCCVILADVRPQSAAAAAGLQVQDIVLSLNGKPVDDIRQFGSYIYQHAGETITLELLRGQDRISRQVAVMERPRDPDRLLGLVQGPQNVVTRLGVLAVDLDERVTPLLPTLRKLSGAVVAGIVADLAHREDYLRPGDVIYAVNRQPVRSLADLRAAIEPLAHGKPVALQIERGGQLSFLTLELE
jgi:serine protease Do